MKTFKVEMSKSSPFFYLQMYATSPSIKHSHRTANQSASIYGKRLTIYDLALKIPTIRRRRGGKIRLFRFVEFLEAVLKWPKKPRKQREALLKNHPLKGK